MGYPKDDYQRKCLTPDCEDTGWYCRGLCKRDYARAAYLVRKGKTTWGDMERNGLIGPVRRPTREQTHRVWDYFLGRFKRGEI